MLRATEEEKAEIVSYMEWQAPDLKVEFVQKVYSESVINHRHDVWDVHTDKDRWWVITNPTNLYSQDQFPSMDLALTFHIGLCIRIPRAEKPALAGLPIEPFTEAARYIQEAHDALTQAEEVADFQAIGVRCREALLAFTALGQKLIPWTGPDEAPKKSDFKKWADHICDKTLAGESNQHRRQLFKTLLNSAWTFSNWLTHTKSSRWHDAEAAVSATENATMLTISTVILLIRGVPEACPTCGSNRLTPERAVDPESGDHWERPKCLKCDWIGEPVMVKQGPPESDAKIDAPPDGECVVPTIPLRALKKPTPSD